MTESEARELPGGIRVRWKQHYVTILEVKGPYVRVRFRSGRKDWVKAAELERDSN